MDQINGSYFLKVTHLVLDSGALEGWLSFYSLYTVLLVSGIL
jgi:hypothetical protein